MVAISEINIKDAKIFFTFFTHRQLSVILSLNKYYCFIVEHKYRYKKFDSLHVFGGKIYAQTQTSGNNFFFYD